MCADSWVCWFVFLNRLLVLFFFLLETEWINPCNYSPTLKTCLNLPVAFHYVAFCELSGRQQRNKGSKREIWKNKSGKGSNTPVPQTLLRAQLRCMSHYISNPCPSWKPLFMFLPVVFCLFTPILNNPTMLPAAKGEFIYCSPLGFTKWGSRCKIRGFLGAADIGVTAGTKVATENK